MNRNLYLNKINGSITLELLIAFTILILNITAVVLVINNSQSISIDIENNNIALYEANSMTEKLSEKSKIDFNLINTIPPFINSFYEKSLVVEQVDLFTKKILTRIAWENNQGYKQKIEIVSLLTNPEAVDGGDTCSSVLNNADGWKQPIYYNFPSINLSGLNLDGIKISSIDVFNNKLYITALNTVSSSNDTFFILNISDDSSEPPIYLGSLDNNPSSISGLNAIKVSKNYAYIANAYTGSSPGCIPNNNCAQLQVVEINNPTNPAIVPSANLKIPTITSSGKLAAGTSIFYKNGYVYLGLAKAISGKEFNIIDVGGGGLPASPINPIWKGGYVVGNGVNSIFVKNNNAYIASPNNENIIILDISNPISPQKIGSYIPVDLPNTNGVGSNHGKSIFVIGNDLYLGRTYGPKEFYVLDGSNYSNIIVKGLPLDVGVGNKTSINKLIIRDYLVFFTTPGQFQVWNISDLENIRPWTNDETTNSFLSMQTLGGNGITMDCENNNIYVAVASSLGDDKDIISVITTNP